MMDPRDFLQLASTLSTMSGASRARTAISRAYYSVFHLSKILCIGSGHDPGNSHGQVRLFLLESSVEIAMEIASELGTLQTARIKADYQMDDRSIESTNKAKLCIENANQVLLLIDQCLDSEQTLDEIGNGIKRYRENLDH